MKMHPPHETMALLLEFDLLIQNSLDFFAVQGLNGLMGEAPQLQEHLSHI